MKSQGLAAQPYWRYGHYLALRKWIYLQCGCTARPWLFIINVIWQQSTNPSHWMVTLHQQCSLYNSPYVGNILGYLNVLSFHDILYLMAIFTVIIYAARDTYTPTVHICTSGLKTVAIEIFYHKKKGKKKKKIHVLCELHHKADIWGNLYTHNSIWTVSGIGQTIILVACLNKGQHQNFKFHIVISA